MDPIDYRLLDDWQRKFPIVSAPFANLADTVEVDETEVLKRLSLLCSAGRISRIGATCAPNTVSASTLAAISATPNEIERVAAVIGAEPGVNHSYLREDTWNLWFVVTGPDREHVNATLARIEHISGHKVLDLRLVRPFNVDLGFRLRTQDRTTMPLTKRTVDIECMQDGDKDILQSLTRGLPMVSRPFAAIAAQMGRAEQDILGRVSSLVHANVISRFGIILHHRALGWNANAMVVWDISSDAIDIAGPALAAVPGITLCYERTPVQDVWPYRLYSMIHARDRAEAHEILSRATALPCLQSIAHKVLFSTHCFKQRGAMITRQIGDAA